MFAPNNFWRASFNSLKIILHRLYSNSITNNSFIQLKRNGAVLLEVKMDNHGVIPEALKYTLQHWKQEAAKLGKPNANPPRFFYTVPTGQNPTGIVVPLDRKKEIYKVIYIKILFKTN